MKEERTERDKRALGKEDDPRCRCLFPSPPASCIPGPTQREAAACGSGRDGGEGGCGPAQTEAGRGGCLQPACRLAQWRGRRPPGDGAGSSPASPSPAATFREAESSAGDSLSPLWKHLLLPPRLPGGRRLPAPLGKLIRPLSPRSGGHRPAPPGLAALFGGRQPLPLLEAFVRHSHPGGVAALPCPALPRAECAPRRRPRGAERVRPVCGRWRPRAGRSPLHLSVPA